MKFSNYISVVFLILLSTLSSFAQEGGIYGTVLNTTDKSPCKDVEVYVNGHKNSAITDKIGKYSIQNIAKGTYTVVVYQYGFSTVTRSVIVGHEMVQLDIEMEQIEQILDEVEIASKESSTLTLTLTRLKSVDGMGIYAGKKSEVINLEMITANLATNNSRQVFSKVAGLNIWESDCAGLQLGVGGRGLSPNRTSNFNTRQNGYDMSADALGYPESYYSPPMQAIKKVEIVRGAASLQYGTHFGGMLNLVLKDGPEKKKIEVQSEQTLGSFNLFNSFNSVGGNLGKFRYYFFTQYRKGDCWRCNSEFEVSSNHGIIKYFVNKKLSLSLESSYMTYVAQQAGGLTDKMFNEDPRQSIRDRNWFEVNWVLSSFNIDYKIGDKTKVNLKTFVLDANRKSLGYLGKISRIDPLVDRDLIQGDFNNVGSEFRLLHRYTLNENQSNFLIGARVYKGLTHNRQGDANNGTGKDFTFLNPDYLEVFDYNFPSYNGALFAENVFRVSNLLTITPGIRYEYINTQAKGYYRNTHRDFAGNIYFDQAINDDRESARQIVLLGIGVGYKAHERIDLYANFSQNYKSISFNDFRISNINLVVDSNMQDEKGYNIDIGMRGQIKNIVDFDISAFYLKYDGRIGAKLMMNDQYQLYRFRTNISDSRNIGVETFMEIDLVKLSGLKSKYKCSIFSNLALIDARYINSEEKSIDGNQVENVPFINAKSGMSFGREKWNVSYQFTYMDQQYSDATNAEKTPDAVGGIIPSYYVMDLSFKYKHKFYSFQTGINNMLNASYFTRRAAAYPGPGIIPSEGRNFYLTLGVKI